MRVVLVLCVVAACGSADEPDATTRLIALDEGTAVTRPVATESGSWPDAPWATLADFTLTVAPTCSVVPGTAGPPRLFTLDGADGDQPIVVQVTPTLAGDCLPRVLACVRDAGATCAPDDFTDESTGVPADHLLRAAFCSAGSCTPADKVIELQLVNPDELDDDVVARITTDAPIEFDSNPFHFFATLVGHLYDANITGAFLVSYEVARDTPPVIERLHTGNYRLEWDGGGPIGIEGQYCSSQAPMGCAVKHDPTRSTTGNQCVASTVGPVDVGIRIWFGEMFHPPAGADALQLEGKVIPGGSPVTFRTDGDAGARLILSPTVSDDAIAVFVEAGATPGPTTALQLGIRYCHTGASGPPTVPRCDRTTDLGVPYDVDTAISIETDAALCPP